MENALERSQNRQAKLQTHDGVSAVEVDSGSIRLTSGMVKRALLPEVKRVLLSNNRVPI